MFAPGLYSTCLASAEIFSVLLGVEVETAETEMVSPASVVVVGGHIETGFSRIFDHREAIGYRSRRWIGGANRYGNSTGSCAATSVAESVGDGFCASEPGLRSVKDVQIRWSPRWPCRLDWAYPPG